MTDRDTILRSIRQSLTTAYLPQAQATPPAPALLVPPPALADQVAGFRRNLEAVRGRVHGPYGVDEATSEVVRLLREAGAGDVLSWPPAELGLPGLAAQLDAIGLRVVDPTVPEDAAGRAAALQQLASVPVGLTGAQAGLADTGSLVLIHAPGRPRFASLLPPVHVAVLHLGRMLPDLATFLAVTPELTADTSNVVIVTGPSRTADIELTPVFGVHGPKRLEVVLVMR